MPSSDPLYDYNEVEDIVDKARSRKPPRRKNDPQATRVKRDISLYHFGPLEKADMEMLVADAAIDEYPKPPGYPRPHLDSTVEYSLDKKKRWEEIREMQENLGKNTAQAVVDLCTPFRGSIWWYVFSGAVDLAKLTERILCQTAVKGKSKNTTLVSHVSAPSLEEPILKFSIVRCYNDSTYHSQLLKYRRLLDRTKRRSTSKIHGKLLYDEEDL